jgi:hypothetical protein
MNKLMRESLEDASLVEVLQSELGIAVQPGALPAK